MFGMDRDERAEQLRLEREQYLRGPGSEATQAELQHRRNQRRAAEAKARLAAIAARDEGAEPARSRGPGAPRRTRATRGGAVAAR